jgi:hypothetical protein
VKTILKTLLAGTIVASLGSVALGQMAINPPPPAPIVHNQESHMSATNAIVEPSGSYNTNQIPALTNAPTPLSPDKTPPARNLNPPQ